MSDIDRLKRILATMNLPAARVDPIDKGWLLRNIAIANLTHPDLDEAIILLKKL